MKNTLIYLALIINITLSYASENKEIIEAQIYAQKTVDLLLSDTTKIDSVFSYTNRMIVETSFDRFPRLHQENKDILLSIHREMLQNNIVNDVLEKNFKIYKRMMSIFQIGQIGWEGGIYGISVDIEVADKCYSFLFQYYNGYCFLEWVDTCEVKDAIVVRQYGKRYE